MFHPIRNFRALKVQVRREIARAYLYEQAPAKLEAYPQMCCYSFDRIGTDLNVDGRCDGAALDALMQLVGDRIEGRAAVDVGANIGNHSFAFARVARRVIALEPHPTTFQLLTLNVSALDNVTLLNLGASDRAATLRAVSPRLNYGATAITDRPALADESEWRFSVAPIDEIEAIAQADVGLIKFDVEGHEAAALRGARDVIGKAMPVIVFEQNPEGIAGGTSEPMEILRSYGYSHFHSLETHIAWRTPQWLPGPLRKIARIFESVLFGPADFRAELKAVDVLEDRAYAMLVATTAALDAERLRTAP